MIEQYISEVVEKNLFLEKKLRLTLDFEGLPQDDDLLRYIENIEQKVTNLYPENDLLRNKRILSEKSYVCSLSDLDTYFIRLYTKNPLINRKLAQNKPFDKVEEAVYAVLCSVFDDIAPLKEDIWVYRGARTGSGYNQITGKHSIFLSTSSDIKVAKKFLKTHNDARLLRIKVPRGSKVLPLFIACDGYGTLFGKLTQYPDEEEILLPPGTLIEDEPLNLPGVNFYSYEQSKRSRMPANLTDYDIVYALLLSRYQNSINSINDLTSALNDIKKKYQLSVDNNEIMDALMTDEYEGKKYINRLLSYPGAPFTLDDRTILFYDNSCAPQPSYLPYGEGFPFSENFEYDVENNIIYDRTIGLVGYFKNLIGFGDKNISLDIFTAYFNSPHPENLNPIAFYEYAVKNIMNENFLYPFVMFLKKIPLGEDNSRVYAKDDVKILIFVETQNKSEFSFIHPISESGVYKTGNVVTKITMTET